MGEIDDEKDGEIDDDRMEISVTEWRYQRRNGAYWQQNGAYRRRNGGYRRRFSDIDDGLVRDYRRQLGFSV